ncbi:hypothetical protein NKG05_29555 [Oerskovia sp. M15]
MLSVVTQGGRDVHDQVHLAPGDAAPRRGAWTCRGRVGSPSPRRPRAGGPGGRRRPGRRRSTGPRGRAPRDERAARDRAVARPTGRGEHARARLGRTVAARRTLVGETPRRRAYLQVLLDDGRGVLLASAQGRWTVEAVYD